MSIIEAILKVYGTNLKKSIKVGEDEFPAWYIKGMSKDELQEKFTNEEIEYIYFHAI